MSKAQLTVAETLKFTRHDFLNDLQIILMNIDLGNPEKARESLLKTTEKLKQHSALALLGLPKTEIWLTAFDWSYPSFTKRLTCRATSPITHVNDEDLVYSLQTIIEKIEHELDVFSVYTAYIDVFSTENDWAITIQVTGNLPNANDQLLEKEAFLVEERLVENLWTFTIRGR